MRNRRRAFLAGCGTALLGGVALNGKSKWGFNRNTTSPVRPGPTADLELLAEGFDQPVALADPPGSDVRYVADKLGRIFVHDENGLQSEPLLDVSDQLAEQKTWEQGLLGFELHPDFETNGKYYVRFSAQKRSGTPDDFSHTFVLSEFEATDDRRDTVPDSERPILELPEPGANHNAGAIEFGPDGYLYVAVGTGSTNGGDRRGKGHAGDWYLLNSGGNGQNVTDNLKGSILRIDVDSSEDGKAYAVPSDNPLVGKRGLDEQYAWGFRNPYRMAFDGDDLYVGDVGHSHYEEVNRVRRGGNYGWNVREGFRCFSNRLPIHALAKLPLVNKAYPACPTTTRSGDPLIDPVVSYPHRREEGPAGVAVIGGYVYRNDTVPALTGEYVFGDLTGGLFVSTPRERGDGIWPIAELNVASVGDGKYTRSDAVLSLGRDDDGELYVLTSQFAEESGKLFKLVPHGE